MFASEAMAAWVRSLHSRSRRNFATSTRCGTESPGGKLFHFIGLGDNATPIVHQQLAF